MQTAIVNVANIEWVTVAGPRGTPGFNRLPQGDINIAVDIEDEAEDTNEFHARVAQAVDEDLSEIYGFQHEGFEYTIENIIENTV